MNFSKISILAFVVAVFAVSTGCSEEDFNSLWLKLETDGTGTITMVQTQAFTNASATVPAEIRGMEWQGKGIEVICRTGTFKKVEDLDILGIRMSAKEKRFRMIVPLGPTASWVSVLMPEQKDTGDVRKAARGAGFTLSEKAGTTFKFVVKLPGEKVAEGANPKLTTTSDLFSGGSEDKSQATLVLPVEKVLKSTHKTLLWEVTWK